MAERSQTTAEIEADGKTVWVHGSDGSCIARFGVWGIDVHTSVADQIAGFAQCLECSHEKTHLADWRRFQVAMRRHYSIGVDDQYMPDRIRREMSW